MDAYLEVGCLAPLCVIECLSISSFNIFLMNISIFFCNYFFNIFLTIFLFFFYFFFIFNIFLIIFLFFLFLLYSFLSYFILFPYISIIFHLFLKSKTPSYEMARWTPYPRAKTVESRAKGAPFPSPFCRVVSRFWNILDDCRIL